MLKILILYSLINCDVEIDKNSNVILNCAIKGYKIYCNKALAAKPFDLAANINILS